MLDLVISLDMYDSLPSLRPCRIIEIYLALRDGSYVFPDVPRFELVTQVGNTDLIPPFPAFHGRPGSTTHDKLPMLDVVMSLDMYNSLPSLRLRRIIEIYLALRDGSY